jgi:hypothetical protein
MGQGQSEVALQLLRECAKTGETLHVQNPAAHAQVDQHHVHGQHSVGHAADRDQRRCCWGREPSNASEFLLQCILLGDVMMLQFPEVASWC